MAFEAFRERDYRLFWTTQFISNIGSWMQAIARGWLVYRLTDSPFLLGFVGFAGLIPQFFLMLPGGVVADKFDRKRVVVASQWVQAAAALWLAIEIYIHKITVWQIIVASLATGVAMSFSGPAYQAMVVDLLDDRRRLPNAIAMNSLQFNVSRVLGPLLAGVTLSLYGATWCFVCDALSFLPLIYVLGVVRDRQIRHPGSPAAMLSHIAEAFRHVSRDKLITVLLVIVAAASLFGYPYLSLMPMIARELFAQNDAKGLGLLMGGVGAGAMAGSLMLSVRMPKPERMTQMILLTLTSFALALGAVGFTRKEAPVFALFVICGASMVVCIALCNTSIQQRIPDALRGRVLSMYTFAFSGFLPFGNLFGGILAEHRGFQVTMRVLGCGLLLTAIFTAMPALRYAPEEPTLRERIEDVLDA
ncbi:MAG TPA: MFS transporter [Thermoanaerobaculia bacterium]|nr:MFS transporter [Thermoanaerobaculia bacterium]